MKRPRARRRLALAAAAMAAATGPATAHPHVWISVATTVVYGNGAVTALRNRWTFDEIYTAPHHGFAGASDYYRRASAMRVADRIPVPALIVAAADDPFVPPSQFDAAPVRDNAQIERRVFRFGGHCGFIADGRGSFDGYWAEEAAVSFLAAALTRA